MLKLGYKASAEQFGPDVLLEFSTIAEAAGFDSVFVSDHFQPWRHNGGHAPNSVAWLGALGACTKRLTIGTSVLTPTFRHHPSIVAQAFATLGVMFPGRVVLGVGTGESMNEVPATGMEWPGFKERFGRMRESILLINRLFSEDRLTFEGEYYKTHKATLYDRPARRFPSTLPPRALQPRSWRVRSRPVSSAPAARPLRSTAKPCSRMSRPDSRQPDARRTRSNA
jgi:coenzyme F420-dependent glucose-6-phosphate dehydrogenase